MTRRQYIIIIGSALILITLAIWLGVKFFSKKPANPDQNTNANQAVSIEKISYKDELTMLKKLFAEKLGKAESDINVSIAREDNTHIKGIVTVKGDYEGVFLAARIDKDWKIVWDGKGKYPCQDILSYNFPGEMVSDCLQ